ncbi:MULTISPECIES: NAD-dependent epimerase/dehydratase family protein [Haloarcula]|uniref:NDP-sugar dehydratase or epimerase n=1 Tax=Haloarcula pellucida TaxID=1427151 RepID=A0A830GGV2_9EURY|nr:MULTISPECIES: NAD-dependent epimerase/dehydratase family protein [Halomicroarcula]MBX0347364.1 NAD-dependent epimerase/dehydratase family protein [Halomicroarcula pellucida]MDS0276762.1 NAD-dependent epimerase/dehydratase family protein [Halomicroarcula sp. S1AR25-4]GGN88303.1 NDP-sugar dehydratase or epimerase [Halomicroarcula pellucida]
MALDSLSDRAVLVTGGAGFVGSHLVAALAPTNDVTVLDDFSTGSRDSLPEGVTVVEGDVRDESTVDEAMAGADVVFHEAAMVSVPESVERPVACHDLNGSATVGVLECARRHDARVVLASSAAVYGDPAAVPVSEDDSVDPASPYGFEKRLNEQYAAFYAETYGLPTVPLRYFNVYGPRGLDGEYAGVIGTFVRQAQAGDPLTVEGDGEQTRDFVYVGDVVRANLRAATTDTVGRPFNVGTGESVTITHLAETVRDVVGATVPIEHVPPREGDIDRSEAAVADARDHLGFEASVTLREGLSLTLAADE